MTLGLCLPQSEIWKLKKTKDLSMLQSAGSANRMSPLARGSAEILPNRELEGSSKRREEEGRDLLLSFYLRFLPALPQQGPFTRHRHGCHSPAFLSPSGVRLMVPLRDVLGSWSVPSLWATIPLYPISTRTSEFQR